MAHPSTLRRTLFAVIAMGFALGLSLAGVEVLLQLADYPPAGFSPWIRSETMGFKYAANLSTRMKRGEYDVGFETNSQGLRDDELSSPAGEGAEGESLRVLMLGDSFTSGYGVSRGESFADLLEKRLGVEVVNAGVGGYEIVHQLHYVRENAAALAPDLIVYALYLGNDIAQNDEWESLPGNRLRSRKKVYPLRPQHELKLEALLKSVLYARRLRDADSAGEWQPFPGYLAMCERELGADARADYRMSRELLEQLRDAVAETGARFLVALFSYRQVVEDDARARLAASIPGFEARYDLDRPAREIGKYLEELGVDYIDLNPALRSAYRESGKSLFFANDGHLNTAGHRVVAGALAPAIAARLPM